MKNTRVWIGAMVFVCALGAPAWSAPALADEPGCVGGVKVEGGLVTCELDATVDHDKDGRALYDLTFHLVKSVHVGAELQLDASKLPIYLLEKKIDIPPQKLTFSILLSGQSIPLQVTLAPHIVLDATPGMPSRVHAVSAALNITSIQSRLPTFITSFLMDVLNDNKQIQSGMVSGVNSILDRLLNH